MLIDTGGSFLGQSSQCKNSQKQGIERRDFLLNYFKSITQTTHNELKRKNFPLLIRKLILFHVNGKVFTINEDKLPTTLFALER